MEISVILPTYNEAENLTILIPKLEVLIKENVPKFEIIVIDDNSIDNTNIIMMKFQDKYKNIQFINRQSEPSLPLSIYEGILSSNYKYVMWLDADGSMSPGSVLKLINKQKLNLDSVIIGSRFIEGGGYKGVDLNGNKNIFNTLRNIYNSEDSILSVALSKIFNIFLSIIMKSPVKDMTSGFIVGKKEVFLDQNIFKCFNQSSYGEYFIYLINELKSMNINLIEVGYICETRMNGVSKTGTNYIQLIKRGFPYLIAVFKIRRTNEKNI